MQRGSTIFLRLAVVTIGLGVFALCTLLLPSVWHVGNEYPDYAFAVYVVLGTLYVTTVPYFLGLFRAWRVLDMIDAGKAFTLPAVNALGFVSRCAAAISLLYALSLPFFYLWADGDDAPGLVVIGMVLTGVPLVLSVCLAVLRRLLHEAIVLKSENDLTV
ncbi:MAG: DUF2975 domain-containing protein [Patescibacteria group bacterium]